MGRGHAWLVDSGSILTDREKDPDIRYWILGGYLAVLVAVYIAPFNCADISRVTVLAPLVVLWRLVFLRHSWWMVLGAGLGLAAGLEGLQCGLSYRSWNVNDMIGNMIGILLGSGLAWLNHARPDPGFPREKP
jgi:VanZ family protein